MPKTRKKKPMSKSVAAALKVMENSVFEAPDLEIQLKHVREKLTPAGIMVDFGTIALAGRNPSGSGSVQINIGTSGYGSIWPEWAYGVAEGSDGLVYGLDDNGGAGEGLGLVTVGRSLLLFGFVCLAIVVLTHVAEEFHMIPGMGWGLPDSPGHYLDFTSAVLACPLLIAGMIWISVNARRSR